MDNFGSQNADIAINALGIDIHSAIKTFRAFFGLFWRTFPLRTGSRTFRRILINYSYCATSGAGGRTRTDTSFYGPRILSPVRLPFRHTRQLTALQIFPKTLPGELRSLLYWLWLQHVDA